MTRILVLSGYDDAMQVLGSLCTKSHAIYAAWNNYDHEVVRQYAPGSHPSWQKLQILLDRYSKYDLILWLDADAIVTNVTKRVEDLAGPTIFTCSHDWCAPANERFETSMFISAGNFVLRTTPDTERFLRTAQSQTQFQNRTEWEQSAIMACMRNNSWMNSQVTRRHRNDMNSVCKEVHKVVSPWLPGHFLCHLTGLGEHKNRMPHVPKYNRELILNIISNLPKVTDNAQLAQHSIALCCTNTQASQHGYVSTTWTGLANECAIVYKRDSNGSLINSLVQELKV